ncbi:hypothetical protein EK904_001997 [Melospiza melodia maxima]|nr:hypothetical protein EK904_001997 [Melospiza melodia maxima]
MSIYDTSHKRNPASALIILKLPGSESYPGLEGGVVQNTLPTVGEDVSDDVDGVGAPWDSPWAVNLTQISWCCWPGQRWSDLG